MTSVSKWGLRNAHVDLGFTLPASLVVVVFIIVAVIAVINEWVSRPERDTQIENSKDRKDNKANNNTHHSVKNVKT